MIETIRLKLIDGFKDLEFNEEKHLYTVDGINYPSVSSKVDKHAPKFDTEAKLITSAKKHKTTPDLLRQQWIRTNKDACDLGHDVHAFMETYTGIETPDNPQKRAGIKFLMDNLDRYEIISREIRMYSKKYKYAGTSDLLLYDKETGAIVVADYKTNKDLFKTYDKLLVPFEYLDSSPYNKYQIQLSYYQIMLEEIGITVHNRLIIYLKSDETYQLFETADLTNELKELL